MNREQEQSLLKVVDDFFSGLREDDGGVGNRAVNGEATGTAPPSRGVPPASIVTPANQKIFNPQMASNVRNQAKNAKKVETERQTDSSINTLPMLLPKEPRPVGQVGPVGQIGPVRPVGSVDREEDALNKQVVGSSQMAGNEVSVSNTQEVMDATSPVAKDKWVKNASRKPKHWADSDDLRRQAAEAQRRKNMGLTDPSSARKEIANARVRLAQASHRRRSLEPPMDSEDADRLDGLRSNLEGRRRPQIGQSGLAQQQGEGRDGIHNARLYLGSDGGESTGASIGSAAGNSNTLHIGRSGQVVKGGGRRAETNTADDFFDVNKLPAHLRKSLDMIKKRKLAASAAKKRKKAIDLTGLQRMKEYDPRRLMN